MASQHVIIVDDADPAVKYSSSGWRKGGMQTEYRQTTSMPDTAGATAQLDFVGSSIQVFGTAIGQIKQNYSFSVDGGTALDFSTPGDNQQHQDLQYFSQDGLTDGKHTLLITGVTGANGQNLSSIDYFMYNQSASAATDAAMLYFVNVLDYVVKPSEHWVVLGYNASSPQSVSLSDIYPRAVGSKPMLWTNATGAQVSLSFSGTNVSVYGSFFADNSLLPPSLSGPPLNLSLSFSIDGGAPIQKLNYPISDQAAYNQKFFESDRLTQANHTLTMNTLSGVFVLDYFLVAPGTASSSSSGPTSGSNPSPKNPSSIIMIIVWLVPVIVIIILLATGYYLWRRKRQVRRREELDLTSDASNLMVQANQPGPSPPLIRNFSAPTSTSQHQNRTSSSPVAGPSRLEDPFASPTDSGIRFHDSSPGAVSASQAAAMDKVQRSQPPPAYTEE